MVHTASSLASLGRRALLGRGYRTKSHSRGGPKGRVEGLGRNFKSCGKEKGISSDPGAWRSSEVQGKMQKPHLRLGLLEGNRSVQPRRAVLGRSQHGKARVPGLLGGGSTSAHRQPSRTLLHSEPKPNQAQRGAGSSRWERKTVLDTNPRGPRCSAVTRETPPPTSSTLAAAHNLPETAQTF